MTLKILKKRKTKGPYLDRLCLKNLNLKNILPVRSV